MTGLIEQYAQILGWPLANTYSIVEGSLDVGFVEHASALHSAAHNRAVLDQNFAVVAAGLGDDGGVEGVSRVLTTMREMADKDRDVAGGLKHRFIGVYDNDYNGKNAFNLIARVDQRLGKFNDIFLLLPVMPEIGDGISDRLIEATQANLGYFGLDWEMEDLCSERLLARFETVCPGAVTDHKTVAGRTHREIERARKPQLLELFRAEADIQDAKGILQLLKLLRGYLGVESDFVQC